MADAAIEFLLNNLKEQAVYHINLINNAEINIEKLKEHLVVFKAFLKDTAKKREGDQIKEMRKKIYSAVYDCEDIIDAYISRSKESGRKNRFLAKFLGNSTNSLHSIGKTVEAISGRIEQLRKEIDLPNVERDKDDKPPETRPPRKDGKVVGFADVTESLIRRLTEETDEFDVISLTGMFGLGKTTLAWKVFSDPTIILRFPTRIWLSVSQQFTEREIFLRILEYFIPVDDTLRNKNPDELADIVADYLRGGSSLIVMDDVWTEDDWEKLKKALPLEERRSKVLITSRHENVGAVASMPRPSVALRKFTKDESWELFRWEALQTLYCPPKLEDVGKKIAEDCDGLPLAIVVIGGILYEPGDSDVDIRREKWLKVSGNVTSYITEEPAARMKKFISLSYVNLPDHLRPCFLYLGLFPEDYEISASKLIRMWIAEGFIQQKVAHISLEEVGQDCLKNLISRNLVKALKFRADDSVKTCQIHDTLLEFCRVEASNEDFLQEIKLNQQGKCVPPITDVCRRISIHSDCERYISLKPSAPRARSFVCFSEKPYALSAQDSTKIIKAFKFLRVFDVQPFKFNEFDSELYNLIHMRYIALSISFAMLPSYFDKMCNIQTLIINTTSRTLKVKANIWNMNHLRLFKTNASATFTQPKSTDCATELQTLGLISVESCKGLHKSAPNLKKLGIRGKLALLFGEEGSFDSLRNIKHLGKLKLVNDDSQATGLLNCLPRSDRFPSGLTSLTLCSTFLKWEEISILGSLKKLVVLKLKDRAFIRNSWTSVGVENFPSLQLLHIEGTKLAFWEAESHHYPKLRSLVLKDCDDLRQIPIHLAEIQRFKMLELVTCPAAVGAAKKIAAEKKKIYGEGSGFKLSIFPPPAE
ncbi:putative late blight resistance protein homolog R1A-3 [Salvia hispanica]|uniref:putative late blight resistance protein homolog R1A-3 n=1 Tax=Salvia hispanica TaxID=49212 RepID=UPI002009D17D|nr:putative late blight resistance protein homolog R1A-3 [Salvia hispanica]